MLYMLWENMQMYRYLGTFKWATSTFSKGGQKISSVHINNAHSGKQPNFYNCYVIYKSSMDRSEIELDDSDDQRPNPEI